VQYSQLISDYKRIIDSSVFSSGFLQLGEFTSGLKQNEDGSERTTLTMFSRASCSSNVPTDLMEITLANIIFSMLDLLLEMQGTITGESFKKRCKSLGATATSTDDIIILEYVYRILRLIRNAVIHNISSITISGHIIEINDSSFSPKLSLKISKENLEKVLQIAVSFSCGLPDNLRTLPDSYIEGVFASIYDKLIGEVIIQDDMRHTPYQLSTSIRIGIPLREQHLDTKYDVNCNQFIRIKKPNRSYVQENLVDYIFEYNGKKYIVPFEMLDQSDCISITSLNRWMMKE